MTDTLALHSPLQGHDIPQGGGHAGAFYIDAVACPCGSKALQICVPGTEEIHHSIAGLLQRGTPDRGWCCVEHARRDGWPWLAERQWEMGL